MTFEENFKNCMEIYSSKRNPGYAILITGEWGVGKTHIIKKHFREEDIYYISLFGIKSSNEIHEALFAKMHPLKNITNKAYKKLTSTLRIGNITLNLSDLGDSFINQFIKDKVKNDKVIIFDDLERTSMSIKEIFGVINEYVEHHKCRVIVIAHNHELEKPRKPDEDFKKMKEKIFGNTIRIQPNTEEAFNSFIESKIHKKTLEENKKNIINIFEVSKCNSLRILNRIIDDLDLLYRCLRQDQLNRKNIISKITSTFTAIGIEVKKGGLTECMTDEISIYANANSDFHKKLRKYNNIDIYNRILSKKILIDLLFNGVFNNEKIQSSIDDNLPMEEGNKKIKPWKIIYDFHNVTKNHLDETVEKIKIIFDEKSEKNAGDLIHLFSCFLFLSKTGEINESLDGAIKKCKEYIDFLYEKNELPYEDFLLYNERFIDEISYDGYGYNYLEHHVKAENINELKNYTIEKTKECAINQLSNMSELLVSDLENDAPNFHHLITWDYNNKGIYANIPILAKIDANIFVEKWLSHIPTQRLLIFNALYNRYTNRNLPDTENILFHEREWIKLVIQCIDNINSNNNGIEKVRIEDMISPLKKEILNFEERLEKQD
ncbi:KAP family NTPase [Xenorhabdus bovienii]|uniref:P-loop NTPase fold protein n=1 Tax=Xenorhabdus bovienii TaxID=40576 RepID=UPI0023B22764|nr:P-loop NTPase fold protein [Xenorhabdus bovienii]MDE9494714.1 KAP family NTPase [Xenorhabdus bovienii]MDE9503079.1 KAP family NTPase [Xenorhabdus bovienii]MDE9526872.1 KAP family NTPase [Xenorhabdus bovienii]